MAPKGILRMNLAGSNGFQVQVGTISMLLEKVAPEGTIRMRAQLTQQVGLGFKSGHKLGLPS